MNDAFTKLRAANVHRQLAWPGGSGASDPLFRAVEVGGEAGELLNAVKKLVRNDRKIAGNQSVERAELIQNLMDELGDVVIAADLLAMQYGVDLGKCVAAKFNKTSRKVGVPVYLGENWEVLKD